MDGWIKLHRQFIKWEWYQDSNMVHLFIYLLLSANHAQNKWRGITIERGQVITGLKSLNNATGISIQSLRTCLMRLESTGEINRQSNNQYTVVTINNYDSYQIKEVDTNKQTNKPTTSDQQSTNKRSTTNNNVKNEKEFKEDVLSYSNEYDDLLLKDFFNYWSEWNKSKTKMRWQLEKTWQTDRRISTWYKRSQTFNKPESKNLYPGYKDSSFD